MIGIAAKSKIVAFVSAIGLMMVGGAATTPANAGETKQQIDFEILESDEPAMIDEIANLTRKLQETRREKFPLQNNFALRGVHPKSHGCVAATFTVLDGIDDDYRVGLFAEPRVYDAWIRYSNAAVLLEPDLKDSQNGSRGMAIKVLGVDGYNMLPYGGEGNQDFLMINTPEFAFANVRDYLRLSRALDADPGGASPGLYFLPAILQAWKTPANNESDEVKERRIILRKIWQNSKLSTGFTQTDGINTKLTIDVITTIKRKTVRNPLEVQYFSAAPFLFGPDRVMKYSVIPAAGEIMQKPFSPEEGVSQDPDYLALALKESLTQGKTIQLSFLVQVVDESQLEGKKPVMIENAAKPWDKDEYPFVKVADIAIQPVGNDKQLVNDCRSLRFTPWHALAAHKPLGGINRLRKPVYCESGEFRPRGGNPTQALCLAADSN